MMRSNPRSAGSSGATASSPRLACHCRVTGKTSSHQHRQRFSVAAAIPHRRAIVCNRTLLATASALTTTNSAPT